ncbi:hypothetical protein GCM10022197_23390 [Microlunatus spumicola]|uniref:DUF4230 domain-containing protein n=1 Tax=Microlunatus spumicola TaxID=81499 RepID=A0ABP6XGZ8_9ACTN
MIARSRVVAAVLATLLVTVAAIAYRLSEPPNEYELVRVPLDQVTAYGSGQVRVSDVRVATEVREGDERYRTNGLFVVVNVAVRATGRDRLAAASSHLLAQGGVTYLPAFSLGASVRADPGFETARDLVYEVDPARIDDLTLELWDQGLVFRYYQRTRTPLGITSANARSWVEAGTGRSVVVVRDDVTRALP